MLCTTLAPAVIKSPRQAFCALTSPKLHHFGPIFNPLDGPQHVQNTGPGLNNGRLNLASGQNEAIGTSVAELISVRVGRVGRNISVISAAASGGIQSRARGTNGVAGAGDGADGGSSVGGDGAVSGIVLGTGRAGVAIGPEDVLAVGVEVDVEADTAGCLQALELGDHSLVLRSISGGLALVGLTAGVGGGATGELPVVGPADVLASWSVFWREAMLTSCGCCRGQCKSWCSRSGGSSSKDDRWSGSRRSLAKSQNLCSSI